jgi:UDPglucose 6-dehydrogenase
MKIAIIGTGYVGLVTGVSLAALGHTVVCIGRDKEKIEKINKAKAPFFEPGLGEYLKKVISKKLLFAADKLKENVMSSEVIIIAVGTPTINNKIDLSAIEEVSKEIGVAIKNSKKYHVVVVKSTVVPTTTEKIVKPLLEEFSKKSTKAFGLCMNPEFLREGQAIEDAMNPDRIVVGSIDKKSAQTFLKIYKKVKTPKLITNLATAEMIKYASNALFATLISYSNEIARICETVGNIDAVDVWSGVHLDKRLSPMVGKKRVTPGVTGFIFSGCGYGGSCFPKDTKALVNFADSINVNPQLIKNVIDVNVSQPQRMVDLLKETVTDLKNKKIVVLGLAFKPNTDDVRESPAFPIIDLLLKEKARVFAHDPQAYKNGKKTQLESKGVTISSTVSSALESADALLLVTAWDEYKKITPSLLRKKMKKPLVIDGRRLFSKEKFLNAGIIYKGIGFTTKV